MLIYGASGHAKVIIDCLEANNVVIKAVFDDNESLKTILEYRINGKYRKDLFTEKMLIIGIGDNYIRKKVSETVFHSFGKVVHPSAQVSKYSTIGEGTVVFHNVVIQAGSQIGKHCIINTSASIDHDCVLEDFVHISPNATLCGNVRVGEGTHIGAGAVVLPNISIGKWCVLGAGAVVTKNIPDSSTVKGIPAR